MLEKLKQLFSDMNSKGIPIPLFRDPKIGRGSLTFSLVVVSAGVCILLLAGKAANLLGGVDYDNALWLLGLTLSTYVGRQYQKNGKQITISGGSESEGGSDDAGTSK